MPKGQRITSAAVKAEIVSRGGVPVFSDYSGPRSLLSFVASYGHTHAMRRDALLRSSSPLLCPTCQKIRVKQVRGDWTPQRAIEEFAAHGVTLVNPLQWRGIHFPIEVLCREGCGQITSISHTQLRLSRTAGRCSDCIRKFRLRGPAHPLWNPILTPEHRLRTQRRPGEIKAWYRAVLKRADFTCALSGQVGGALSAHHLYNLARHPDLALDLDNGVCITRNLHHLFHKRYGRVHNTKEQFDEFAAQVRLALPSPYPCL